MTLPPDPVKQKTSGSGRRELYSIQSLRGVAALMVVLNHAQLWQLKYFHQAVLLPPWFSVGEAGVDLFFVISGFIMVYVTPRPFRGWRDQAAFLISRFFRIYPVYWGVAFPLLLAWLVNPKLLNNTQGNHLDFHSSFLLMPSHTTPILTVAWSLIYEVYFYCVASFIFYFGGFRRVMLEVTWFAIIALFLVIHVPQFQSACLAVWLGPLTLEFISGMMLAHLLQRDFGRIPSGAAFGIFLFALTWGISAGVVHGRFWFVDLREPIRLLIYGVPAFLLVGVVLKMEMQNEWPWTKKAAWLGDRSYSIYLLHVPVLGSFLCWRPGG